MLHSLEAAAQFPMVTYFSFPVEAVQLKLNLATNLDACPYTSVLT